MQLSGRKLSCKWPPKWFWTAGLNSLRGQIKKKKINYTDGTTGSTAMMTKWGRSHNEPAQLRCPSRCWRGRLATELNSFGGPAQRDSAASWKHLTRRVPEASFKCLPALHQIIELRCDFLFSRAAWGSLVHQVYTKKVTFSKRWRRSIA